MRPQPEVVKDFVTLQREAEERWAAAQRQMAIQIQDQDAQFALSPDVLMRPDPTMPWSYTGIVCPCGGTSFFVSRWITISGIKHRCECTCTACGAVLTWDWHARGWVT